MGLHIINLLVFLLVALRGCSFCNASPSYPWSLETSFLTLRVRTGREGLRWSIDAKGVELMSNGSVPKVHLEGEPARFPSDPSSVSVRVYDGGHSMELSSQVDVGGGGGVVTLRRIFETYPDSPHVVRTWAGVNCTSSSSTTVTGIELLAGEFLGPGETSGFVTPALFSTGQRGNYPTVVGLHPNNPQEFLFMGSRSSGLADFSGHRARAAWFALDTGAPSGADGVRIGVAAGIEFNGKSTASLAGRSLPDGSRVVIPFAVTMDQPVAHRVPAGEGIDLPAAFLALYETPEGSFCPWLDEDSPETIAQADFSCWDEAGAATQWFSERHVHPPLRERYPYVQYDSWSYGLAINESNQMAAMEVAGKLGLEVFVLDLGWSYTKPGEHLPNVGDYWPDPVKFPNGLRALADRAKELGIKFGLHVPLTQVNIESKVAMEHPNWLSKPGPPDYFGCTGIVLADDNARGWLRKTLLDLVDVQGAEYFVTDGEDPVKRCDAGPYTFDPADCNYANAVHGIDELVSSIRRERPDVVWENCEDGGNMDTFKMAALFDTTLSNDCADAYGDRVGTFSHTFPFGLHYATTYVTDSPLTNYSVRSGMVGGPLILQQVLSAYDSETVSRVKLQVDTYKRLRDLFYRGQARVVHLLAPAFKGKFFPSSLPYASKGYGWDAIQVVTWDGESAVVFAFRALGGPSSLVIKPRLLQPGRTYTITYSDTGKSFTRVGSDVLKNGLNFTLPEEGSDVVWFEQSL